MTRTASDAVETKISTPWKKTDPKVKTSASIRCEYGMWWPIGTAQRPSFSITYFYGNAGFGRDEETIGRYFPELLDLLPFHLWDDEGAPMHYEANGLYWAEKTHGIFKLWPHDKECEPPDPKARAILANYIGEELLGDTGEVNRELRALATGDGNDAPQSARKGFKDFLRSRLPRMKALFDAAMARHGVKMIDTEKYAQGV